MENGTVNIERKGRPRQAMGSHSSDLVSGKSLNRSNPSKYNLPMFGGDVGSL